MEKIEALITDISFRNEDNGFTVLQVRLEDGKRTSAVGVMPEFSSGERVLLSGEWSKHPQYGDQIKVALCEVVKPTTERGIERYLASGLIRGIGPATAKLIVREFGADTLDILQYAPERLREVPGIGKKRVGIIMDSYAKQYQMREAMVFMQSYGISPSLSMKIFKKYGEHSQKVINENPYRLVEDIEGVGFRTADQIAASLGISKDSPGRLRAGICFALTEASVTNGHTYLPKETLLWQVSKLLDVEEELAVHALSALLIDQALIARQMEEHVAIYLPRALKAERETARKLLELHDALPYRPDPKLAQKIDVWQSQTGITLNRDQVKAIHAAVSEGVSVITGGPGTGKTTIIRCILSQLSEDMEVVLAAPTGRAAKRMSEATGYEAKTLHRLLEYGGEDGLFSKNEENPIEADVLIIDEMSMVDIFLMRGFLRALLPGTRLVLVGDADQLPSVGAGNVLRDIIQSDTIPYISLSEIYRQDAESMIVVNAHRINHGNPPVLNSRGSDFFLERCDTAESAAQCITHLLSRRLPDYLHADPLRDMQVLSPMKKGDCGVWALNRLLQQTLNPPKKGTSEFSHGDTLFRVGDKVMQIKNNYQTEWIKEIANVTEEGQGVFNGDMGLILAVDEEEKTITVRFEDDREVLYEDARLEELELAYCISVHKSQGSEFPIVVMPVVGGPPMLLTRNLFYTAVTRAKKMVVLVGRESAVREMVQNATIAKRFSGLSQWLQEAVTPFDHHANA